MKNSSKNNDELNLIFFWHDLWESDTAWSIIIT